MCRPLCYAQSYLVRVSGAQPVCCYACACIQPFAPSNSLRAELSAQLGQDPTALNQLQILWGGLSPGKPFVSLSEGMRSKNW